MKPLVVSSSAHGTIAMALHCILNIPPIVNYLISPLLEGELLKKRANAVGFTRSVATLAKVYWDRPAEAGADLDVSAAAFFFRKIHRTTYTPPALALRQMYQIMHESLTPTNNFMQKLGGVWIVHQPGCRHDTVQQLVNSTDIDGLPHLIFVQIDRGDRVKRFIDYGTLLKVVKSEPRHSTIQINRYELATVLMETEEDMQVFAKASTKWQHLNIRDNTVQPLLDLNKLISVQAQVLAYLRCP